MWGGRKRPRVRLGSHQAERVCWSWPARDRLQGPREAGRGPSWKYRGPLQLQRSASSSGRPCQVGEAALTGEWQVPAGRVPKATESGATASVSGHVGARAVPGRPGAASLPGVPLSWRYPAARQPKDP